MGKTQKVVLGVAMGSKGITRMTVTIDHATIPRMAEDITKQLQFTFEEERLGKVKRLVEGQPDLMSFVGDSRGYSISIGFVK